MGSRLLACVVLVGALVVGGCGGGSSSGTKTVTVTGGATISSTTVDEKRQLEDFLATIKPFHDRGHGIKTDLNSASSKLGDNPTADDLKTYGQSVAKTTNDIQSLANDMAAVQPPAALAKEYTGWVAEIQSLTSDLDALATDAKNDDVSSLVDDANRIKNLSNVHTTTFKVKLIQQLTKEGIGVPQWVKDLGANN